MNNRLIGVLTFLTVAFSVFFFKEIVSATFYAFLVLIDFRYYIFTALAIGIIIIVIKKYRKK